ncbi:methyltransferase, putative, partial [Hepatocystis sp. ex Piliocolobus tephrosceles]
MNIVKLSLDSYPAKYYNKTHKITNILKLKGIGLRSSTEDELKCFLKKLNQKCMVYLIENEDIIYLEFYKKDSCKSLFTFFNKNKHNESFLPDKTLEVAYTQIRYRTKDNCSNVYTKDYTKLIKNNKGIFIYNNIIDDEKSQSIIDNYEKQCWHKYTNNDEINLCYYFCRSTPNRIYKSYCIQDSTDFFSPNFLTKIKNQFNNKEPNQITIIKCHVKKAIEYVIESSYIFQDEIAYLILENDLPMSFLDMRTENKVNMLMPKNTLIRISGQLRYELLFGIPKKKKIFLEDSVVERKNSYLLIFRFINENNLDSMLMQKQKKEIVKDAKQNNECTSININDYTSENLEKKYVLDVYNQIAKHFCYTRYKSWNNVERIINEEKEGNLIMDIGCGNGKNAKLSSKYFFIGLDFSFYLLKLAKKKSNSDLFLANCINIPIRSNIVDLCISIAVIHHIGTHEKRKQAVEEMVRVTKVGGRVLIYVWAYEQKENTIGNRKFDSQDIFVPWYLQPQHTSEVSVGLETEEKKNCEEENNCQENLNTKTINFNEPMKK